MKPVTFVCRDRPKQRLDLSGLIPRELAGQSLQAINAIQLQTTSEKVMVGDVFRVRAGDASTIRIEGSDDRFDNIGLGLSEGEIQVEGDVGIRAGRLMTGGRMTVSGDAGPWAGSRMSGGVLEVRGMAGDYLGGPIAGEMVGMRGGAIVVRGRAGDRIGDRMRRGAIIVEGLAGDYAGSRMIAGSIVIRGRAGQLPGYLMVRGTLLLAGGASLLSPSFVDAGAHDLVALRLMASFVAEFSSKLKTSFRQTFRRYSGDQAVLGSGEIFLP